MTNYTTANYFFGLKTFSLLFILFISKLTYAQTGTWAPLTNLAPDANMGVMMLMTDGTILCHTETGSSDGTEWDKLTPSATGSYVNGTWSQTADMHYGRLFFPSQVMPSGKLFAAGGEYGSGDTSGEVYDPVANTWTLVYGVGSGNNICDGNSEILPNGKILLGPQIGPNNLFYSPTTNDCTVAPNAPLGHDEAQWLKLPDSSILFVGIGTVASCRYEPKTNTWISDANLPDSLYDKYGGEAGSAALLPNGKAIFFGATGHNCIYTPTGTTAKGSWARAADFPFIHGVETGMVDAPSAMMVNGHILCAVSPIGTSGNAEFNSPTYFVEYNYLTNTFAQVTSPITGTSDTISEACYMSVMLDLPTGQVLYAYAEVGDEQYYIYTPGSAAIAAGKPTISSILPDGCPNYKITGKLFNGISEGVQYGDDWQMSSNYPLVRCTNAAGDVYYCKTTNWNRIGAVMTDSAKDTAVFSAANLPVGTYSLVVVVNGFASNPTIFTTLQASMASHQNILCNGTSSGTATVSVTGGISPYTYSWSASGGSGATGTGLSAGTYTVTIHDNNDCVETASVVITQPATKVTASASVTKAASCGNDNGSASSTVSGGASPYTYSWSDGAGSNSTATGLSAGTYTLSVTDNNGCVGTVSITITQSPAISNVSASITSNIKCNGENDGSATVTFSGGTSPYTYSWTGGGGSNAIATGLNAGTYTITVTDKNGCSGTASATITQPAVLAASASATSDANCAGNNGSASSTISGGTLPYTYSWSGGAGTNATATGLSAGTYTLTVTDYNGCTHSATVTITQATSLTNVSASTTVNIKCNGSNDGIATASTTGGTAPYTYVWSSSAGTNATATGLSAGTYTITITDKNGCSGTASTIITQPSVLTTSGSVVANANCGGNNGIASSNVSGGTAPYTYAWTGGGTNSTISGLSAGNYTVTVTDNNGCANSATITITQTTGLSSVSANTISNVSCNGANNGSLSATVVGGTGPYTYSWTGGGTNSTINGLSAGTYTLNVTDKNGCNGTAVTIITQPSILAASGSISANATCGGNNGVASSSASGGTLPYTYSWSNGAGSNSTATGLSAGTYTLSVTDNNGCIGSAMITITQSPGISNVSATIVNVKCNGMNDGSATATVSGGTAPYTFTWEGGGTNSTLSGLAAGTYTVSVTDNKGCNGTASVIITQPTALAVKTYSVAATNAKDCDGEAAVTASGGTEPYTYSWSPNAQTTDTIKNQCAADYCCTITDKNGCTESTCVTITVNSTGIANIINTPIISVYPEPNDGQFTVALQNINEDARIEIFNLIGERIYTSMLNKTNTAINLKNRPSGMYLYRISTTTGTYVSSGKLIIEQE